VAINPVSIQFTGDAQAFFAEIKRIRGEFGALRGEASKISGAFSKVGDIVKGYLSFRAVTGLVRKVVEETREAAAAQAQLDSALASTNANVKAASAEFQAYASDLQRTTNFSDDAVMQVQSLLLSFRDLSGETVKRATDAVLDLSTRMGIEAPAAAKLLGKALADPEKGLTALAKAGVGFSDSEKERIKLMVDAGRKTEAQAELLAKLEERFGGAAEAARNTFGGALTGLNNAFGDLLEGGAGFNGAAASINNLAEALNSEQVRAGFAAIVSGLAKVIELAAKATAGIASFARQFGEGLARAVSGPIPLEYQDLEEIQRKIEGLEQTRQRAIEGRGRVNMQALEDRLKLLRGYEEQLLQAEQARAGAAAPSDALNFTTTGVDEGLSEDAKRAAEDRLKAQKEISDYIYKNEMSLLESITNDGLKIAAADRELEIEQLDAHLEQKVSLEQEAANERYRIESDLQSRIQSLREGAINAGIGLLQFLAQKSKAAAIGLIVVNKALAISQAIQNTAAAATKALAIYGPTPAGFAAAGAAKAFGAIQIGLIAATGALEIASVGSGGGGPAVAPGTPNNPVYTQQQGEGAQPGVTSQRALQVVFAGPVYGMNDFKDQLVEMLREEVDERDVLIIGGNSRQAQELRGA